MSKKRKYDVKAFYYICGTFINVRGIKLYLTACEKLCEAYFKRPLHILDTSWVPHIACSNCKRCIKGKQIVVK